MFSLVQLSILLKMVVSVQELIALLSTRYLTIVKVTVHGVKNVVGGFWGTGIF